MRNIHSEGAVRTAHLALAYMATPPSLNHSAMAFPFCLFPYNLFLPGSNIHRAYSDGLAQILVIL